MPPPVSVIAVKLHFWPWSRVKVSESDCDTQLREESGFLIFEAG